MADTWANNLSQVNAANGEPALDDYPLNLHESLSRQTGSGVLKSV